MIGKLPSNIEALFKEAANTGLPGSLARRIAIDRAYESALKSNPELFKKDTNMKVNFLARCAFINVFEPTAIDGGDPAFNGKFIIDPADKATVNKLD
jgi:hypothetical protein